jgi:hypothetical protein
MAFNSSKLRFKALERPSGYPNYSVNINLVTMVYTSPTHTAVGIKPYAYTLRCIDKRRYKENSRMPPQSVKALEQHTKYKKGG